MPRTRQRALVAGAALVFVAAGCGSSGRLGAHGLSQQSKAVQSEAAEGALLAGDAAAGRSTSIFVREHASELAKTASSAAGSLKTARTGPALMPELRALTRVAVRVSTALQRLRNATRDEQRALARELQSAADESAKIGARAG